MSAAPCLYLAGVAQIDATPPVGSWLTGFAARTEPSAGVYLPLRGVVIALTDRATGVRTILVSLEWLGFYDRTAEVRARIAAATGVPEDHILLGGTHTHGGPAVHRHVPGDCWEETDEGFLTATFAKLATAAQAALSQSEPVALRSTTGWCGFAHSRRRPDGRGGVEWMPTLDAPHDHTVPVLLAEDGARRPKFVMFGYACHPTGGGPKREIGGDYVGFALAEVERELGCPAAFLLGCAGDQKPYRPDPAHASFPAYPVETLREFGGQLAAAVVCEVRFGRLAPVAGPLRVQSRQLGLQTTVLPRAEYAAALDSASAHLRRWAAVNLARLDCGETPPTALNFELQTLAFGRTLLLVAMAGEMSVEYGLRLGREFGGRYGLVWPVGYANAIVGYVPSERQIPEGGYEVIGSMQYLGKTGPLVSGTEEQIVAAVRAQLAET
ncbi:MAG: hypothetical protein ACHQ4G_02235 [Opitutales bacterium]